MIPYLENIPKQLEESAFLTKPLQICSNEVSAKQVMCETDEDASKVKK